MAKIKLDAQQEKVRDTLNNVVVCAGAGAGKTTVLSERFTKLVSEEKIPVEKILTLTFTEKAATEMKERIYKVLSANRNNEYCNKACIDFDKSHIQTLDSYFSEITKQGASVYGINPNFTLDDEAVKNLIQRKAYEFVNKYKEDPRIRALASDPTYIAKEYFFKPIENYTNIAEKYDFVADVKKQADILKKEYDTIAETISPSTQIDIDPISILRQKDLDNLQKALEKARKAADKLVTTKEKKEANLAEKQRILNKFIESKQGKQLTPKDQEALQGKQEKVEKAEKDLETAVKNYNEHYSEALNHKNALENEYPLKEREIQDFYNNLQNLSNSTTLTVTDIYDSNVNAIKNLISANCWIMEKDFDKYPPIKFLRENYSNLYHLLNSVSGYRTALGLAELAMDFVNIIQEEKKSAGLLTFNDVSNLARKILIEQKDIRQEEKAKYAKIMIDEFQDNNQMQLDILELLAEQDDIFSAAPEMKNIIHNNVNGKTSGKLFFVGDEKQSIYSFRGAEVDVFNRLQSDIQNADIGGEKLSISTNNRSEAELIAAFNTVFGGYTFPNKNNLEVEAHPVLNPSLLMTSEWFEKIGQNILVGIKEDTNLVAIPSYEASYSEVLIPEIKMKYAISNADENGNLQRKMHIALLNTAIDEMEEDESETEETDTYTVSEETDTEIPEDDNPDEILASSDSEESSPEPNTENDEASIEYKDSELEATWIAHKIQQYINDKRTYHVYDRTNSANDKDVSYTYNDFAILLRSTTHLPEYLSALQKYNIPYVTEAYKDLFSDGPFSDIYSYLCVYINHLDMHSYASVLHSPFVNLSLKDTQLILSKRSIAFDDLDKGNPNIVINKQILDLYNSAKRKFEEFSKYAQNATLTEVITYLWYDLGYRYETLKNQTTSMYAYLYDVMFDFARKEENKGGNISSFVRLLAKYKDEDEKLDGISLPLETKGVHILTIHKSKGLEYPCVFVAGISDSSASDTGNKVLLSDEYGYIATVTPDILFEQKYNGFNTRIRTGAAVDSVQTNYFYHNGQAVLDRKNQSLAELRRLTYVAFTRAIDQLYIVGHFNNAINSETAYSNEVGIVGQINPVREIMLKNKTKSVTYGVPSNIYGLILPVLNRYMKETDNGWETTSDSPFDLEIFQTVESESKDTVISTVKPEEKLYDYLNNSDSYSFTTPSSLELSDDTIRKNKYRSKSLENVSELINQIQTELFDTNKLARNDFGTIAHSFMEQAMLSENFNKTSKEIFAEDCSEVLEILEESEKQLVINACQQMIENFRSWFIKEFGKPEEIKFLKPEFSFRYFDGHTIIHGTMDLVFEISPGHFVIIDYKTDENIIQEKYEPQLRCYKDAIDVMFPGTDNIIDCYLYLLRNGDNIKLS